MGSSCAGYAWQPHDENFDCPNGIPEDSIRKELLKPLTDPLIITLCASEVRFHQTVKMPKLHQYDYLFVIGLLFSALDAYNIGANDVAK